MSLYKQRGSEVWWLNISHPGHSRVRESTGEHDRDAAQKVHDERKAALWKIDPTLKGRTNDPHHVKVFPSRRKANWHAAFTVTMTKDYVNETL